MALVQVGEHVYIQNVAIIPVHVHFHDPTPEDLVPEFMYDKKTNMTYQKLEFLGKGGFGRCYSVEEVKSKEKFACKLISKGKLRSSFYDLMAEEIRVHRILNHRHIVKLVSYFEDDLHVQILMELCTKGSLSQLLRNRTRTGITRGLTEVEIRYYLRQILLAAEYIHDKKIVHRDIKPPNIFIDENMKVKLGDFGLAVEIKNGVPLRKSVGTPNYIAPEVFLSDGYDTQADIWSIGSTAYMLLYGQNPAQGYPCGIMFPYTINISIALKTLIFQMLEADPAQRPNAKELLASDYLLHSFIPRQMPAYSIFRHVDFSEEENEYERRKKEKELLLAKACVKYHTVEFAERMAYDGLVDKSASIKLIRQLMNELKSIVDSNPLAKMMASNDNNNDPLEDSTCRTNIWICNWLYDLSFGFCYQLSDDTIGISFNDKSKLVLISSGSSSSLNYFDPLGNEHFATKDNYPVEITTKLKCLNYVEDFLKKFKKTGDIFCKRDSGPVRVPTMWSWLKTSSDITMLLSCGVLQINNLKDHSKVIFCPLMKSITIIEDGHQPMRAFKFSAIKTSGCTEELFHKIRCAIETLETIMNSKDHKKAEKEVENF